MDAINRRSNHGEPERNQPKPTKANKPKKKPLYYCIIFFYFPIGLLKAGSRTGKTEKPTFIYKCIFIYCENATPKAEEKAGTPPALDALIFFLLFRFFPKLPTL